MKTNADDSISPSKQVKNERLSHPMAQGMSHSVEYAYPGLTKREYFAGLALQGLVSRQAPGSIEVCTAHAVVCADALIEALNRE